MACSLVYVELRGRAKQIKHGMENEPRIFFLAKNAVFAAVIVYFSYLLASYKGIPNVLAIMSILIVAYTFITNRTVLGRWVYAVGGNEKAARLSGIKTKRVSFYTFDGHLGYIRAQVAERRDKFAHCVVSAVFLHERLDLRDELAQFGALVHQHFAAQQIERLDRVGALVNQVNAGAAHILLHAKLGDVAVPAEHLHRFRRGDPSVVGDEGLDHRSAARRRK
jgi:hypothetical protein